MGLSTEKLDFKFWRQFETCNSHMPFMGCIRENGLYGIRDQGLTVKRMVCTGLTACFD